MPTDYAIKDGRTVFDATTYTGDGASTRTITTSPNFTPDLYWLKNRTDGFSHLLYDTIRGAGENADLASNTTAAEGDNNTNATYGYVSAFTSNGISVVKGSNSTGYTNTSGSNYVTWQWKAGGTAVSNTAGSITSSVSADTAAGFSIVTYTGTGASGTVGHGLGVAPKFIIYKSRSNAQNWLVNIGAVTGTQGDYIYFNGTQGKLNSANVLNGNSTTFSVSGSPENNQSGITFVAYCWAEVAGFSKFGGYTGNGSTDGVFVYTGFKPKCIIVKSTSNASDWTILDSSRNTYNLINSELNPNGTSAEYVANTVDFLSNGFKLRATYGNTNGNGYTYVYMAFAETPFKYANAR